MISSTGNSLAKQAAALGKRARSRRESGLFLVEGPKMFEELPKDRVEQVFVTERFLEDPDHQRMVEQVDGKKVVLVTGEVLKSISDTQTPQGVAAVARQYRYSLEDIRDGGAKPLVMFLETIQDPGNLGTILRAGEAAGVTGVIMDRESADIYNPKVIRSTMGSVYRVPFLYVDELGGTVREFKGDGLRLYAAHLDGKHAYDREDYRGACGFLVGNEAKGLRRETADLADAWVRIPMKGNVESLNAAVASALLMFEAARQRRG
ncbi:MAG: RNA methyltransferase [Hungatella sp.]|nr:RNA methyltransferase [Hungatella sp.]